MEELMEEHYTSTQFCVSPNISLLLGSNLPVISGSP